MHNCIIFHVHNCIIDTKNAALLHLHIFNDIIVFKKPTPEIQRISANQIK